MNNAYSALATVAASLALPVRFSTDLHVHDKAACEKLPDGTPFVWAIGEGGTWIATPDQRFANARGYAAQIAEIYPNLYMWDGTRLSRVDVDTVEKFLARHT